MDLESSAPYSRLAGVYDELVVDPCFAQWAHFLDGLWQGERLDRVLDLCCGTGLMTVELAARAGQVVGLDASGAMLELARKRPELAASANVAFVEAELPAFPVDGSFDAVVSTFDGLNYLPPSNLALTFTVLAEHLREGGWLIFDVHGEAAADFLRSHPVIEGEDAGRSFTLTSFVSKDGTWCSTAIELEHPDPTRSFTETHVQYLHSAADVQHWLEAAGFDILRVVDEYTDVPAGPDTLRSTWIARRNRTHPEKELAIRRWSA